MTNRKTLNSDLVSIILPTYNRENTLDKAINSVINQTHERWELIIVDDASIDDTANLVRRFADKDNRIIYIQEQENRGANYCRNIGAKISKGDYIAFLDSDNYWETEKLEVQLKALKDSEEKVAFVFCDEIINNGINKYFFPDREHLKYEVGKALLIANIVDTNTALVKRKYFEEVGGFDENMPRLQDWEFFFRIVNVYGYKAIYIPKCLNKNVIQNNSISRDNRKYVDAIFYLLKKYPELFFDIDLILSHIRNAFVKGDGEPAYICKKIYEVYSEKPHTMQGILLNMYKLQNDTHRKLQRQYQFYSLLYEWKLKSSKMESISLFSKRFRKKDTTIAIYGLGRWGELFYHDIKALPVKILYGIDKKVEEFHSLQIKRPDDQLEEVDLLVVTVFQEFEEVKAELQEKYTGRIVSIEELIRQA